MQKLRGTYTRCSQKKLSVYISNLLSISYPRWHNFDTLETFETEASPSSEAAEDFLPDQKPATNCEWYHIITLW